MKRDIWQKIRAKYARWQIGALPGFTFLGLIILVRLTGFLQYHEWLVFDSFLRWRPMEQVDDRITIIGINEADIQSLKAYPIPDRELALLINTLQEYQPRAIGLDIVRDHPVEPGHQELTTVFEKSKNLFVVEKILPEKIAPPPISTTAQIGFIDAMTDDDARLRRSLLGMPNPQKSQDYKHSLTLRLATAYLAFEGIGLENGIRDVKTMRFGSVELPQLYPYSGGYVGTDAGGLQILLNYRNSQNQFHTLSLSDVKSRNFDPAWLRDRIIIIGMTTPSAKDVFNVTAISTDGSALGIYGVEVQAHAVSQIISAVLDGRSLIWAWADGWEYLWIISWGIVGIVLGWLPLAPHKNFISVGIASICLVGASYALLTWWGLWIPVVPTVLVLVLNGIGLTAFYQYDRAMRSRLNERQLTINHTYSTIHNGPLQTLKLLIKQARDRDIHQNELISKLTQIDSELREVYESLEREVQTQQHSLRLGSGQEINLSAPLHETLYQVYSQTLERDFPCYKTLQLKIPNFEPIDERHLSIEQKRSLCQFLEEALCNVGKHAKGVTCLRTDCLQKEDQCIVRVKDNGSSFSVSSEGRGTKQAMQLARQLRGKFQRQSSSEGTICELTWHPKKSWFS
ncbi:CHASE2 domain-containing protein [Gloeocapsopsis dulcis]|uniref:Histidine kinase n=1 Tax=Gloeocapsopsis dulcis AAB1 = 1H9 TaxID=1433147 RepID=A0A6N8FN69_9CHRO|nr:CHASE2 domain-containing protein [Gloeocapsopsis dulcis]MUL34928.1 histidine kinase [Gloeocapsopsis dulcis AAB1 = 1H9]WNN90000.1 CHASE2 domain-containing protein [Gloeocapsopsis dulcis]